MNTQEKPLLVTDPDFPGVLFLTAEGARRLGVDLERVRIPKNPTKDTARANPGKNLQ